MSSSLIDLKRSFYATALGLLPTQVANMSVQDLETKFFTTTAGQFGNNRYGFIANKLPKWNNALSRVLDGTANAKIMMIGDSTYFGIGATNATAPFNGSPCTRMVQLMNAAGIPAQHGLVPPGTPDTRWTLGSGWSAQLLGLGSLACYGSGGVVASTFAENRFAWDKADCYYLQGPGIGTETFTATGGSAATATGNNATSSIQKVTATAASKLNTNSVSFVPTSGTAYCAGIEVYDSTAFKVLVANGGIGTVGAQQHAAATTTWGTIPFLNAYQPNLTCIGVGINDRGNGRTVNQYVADMQTIITGAKVWGDVILCTENPSQNAPQSTGESDFNNAILNLAATNGLAVYDYYGRCGSWTAYNAAGNVSDALHPNEFGYWDFARGLVPALIGL